MLLLLLLLLLPVLALQHFKRTAVASAQRRRTPKLDSATRKGSTRHLHSHVNRSHSDARRTTVMAARVAIHTDPSDMQSQVDRRADTPMMHNAARPSTPPTITINAHERSPTPHTLDSGSAHTAPAMRPKNCLNVPSARPTWHASMPHLSATWNTRRLKYGSLKAAASATLRAGPAAVATATSRRCSAASCTPSSRLSHPCTTPRDGAR